MRAKSHFSYRLGKLFLRQSGRRITLVLRVRGNLKGYSRKLGRLRRSLGEGASTGPFSNGVNWEIAFPLLSMYDTGKKEFKLQFPFLLLVL